MEMESCRRDKSSNIKEISGLEAKATKLASRPYRYKYPGPVYI